MASITYSLLPSQTKFVNSAAKYVMYSGGYGSGKSAAACMALLRQCTIPGNEILLLRKTLVSLKKSTLVSLIGGAHPILPRGSYTYLKAEGLIQVNGGATIYTAGLDEPTRIRSMNLGLAVIDEVSELTEEEFNEVRYRLRNTVGSRQLFCCTNPAGVNHHLYKFFFLTDKPNRQVITASSLENTHLPADYIEELKLLEGSQRRRYLEGVWCQMEGGIFETFDRNLHMKVIPGMTAFDEFIVGLDMGYTHPAGIVVVGRAGDRLHVVEEWRKPKCLIREIMAEVVRIASKYDPVFVYDPSAASLGGELANLQLNAFKADNDVAASIDRIRNRLAIRKGNDSPDLVVSDFCPMLVAELESYCYKEGTEKPVKVGDDLIDPLRYVVNYVDNERAEHPAAPFLMASGDDDVDEDGWNSMSQG